MKSARRDQVGATLGRSAGRAPIRTCFLLVLVGVFAIACGRTKPVVGESVGDEAQEPSSDAGNSDKPLLSGDSVYISDQCHEDRVYVTDIETCPTISFLCSPEEGAFADECGCGCSARKLDLGEGPLVDLPTECNGPSGLFAFFAFYETADLESIIDYMVMGEDSLYFWVVDLTPRIGPKAWSVDKATGAFTVRPELDLDFFRQATDNPAVSAAGVVSYLYSCPCDGGDGYMYKIGSRNATSWLVRTPKTGGPDEFLFSISQTNGEAFFAVFDSDFYATNEYGELWHAKVWPEPTEPVLVEKRGAWDWDDHYSVIGIDNDAVYWKAGVTEWRADEDSPMAVFRTCRPK